MDEQAWRMLFAGAWVTAWTSGLAIAMGVVIGLGLALLRMARIPLLDPLLAAWISFARATPLVTLVLFIFLASPKLGLSLNREVAAVLALTINTSAFNAEVWRSAFRGFSREQLELIIEAFPKAAVMVRVFDRRHAMALEGLDVRLLQREVFDSAVVMGRAALRSLGIAEREAARVEAEYRERDLERLRVQTASGDLKTGIEQSFTHSPLED